MKAFAISLLVLILLALAVPSLAQGPDPLPQLQPGVDQFECDHINVVPSAIKGKVLVYCWHGVPDTSEPETRTD